MRSYLQLYIGLQKVIESELQFNTCSGILSCLIRRLIRRLMEIFVCDNATPRGIGDYDLFKYLCGIA